MLKLFSIYFRVRVATNEKFKIIFNLLLMERPAMERENASF